MCFHRNCIFNLKKDSGEPSFYGFIILIVRRCLSFEESRSGDQHEIAAVATRAFNFSLCLQGGFQVPLFLRLNVVEHICNASTWEVEAGGSGI